ncbi:MAG: cyclase family protein [Clostridiaceae bacterium]|nr:cyclase family protein [Clostridiaceae bacterium]
MKLIDLSHVIYDGMPVYPGDPNTKLSQIKYYEHDEYNNFKLDICMHSGTHVDAPMHLTESKQLVSEIPLESFMGDGCVLDVRGHEVITMKEEYKYLIKEGCILLLYTGFDEYYGTDKYYENHPCIDMDSCKFLVNMTIKMVGMDIPSPDKCLFEIHKKLLSNNIYIIENLTNLDKLLETDRFEIFAFPLKIKADSSISRVVAKAT